jgi:rubredoxin
MMTSDSVPILSERAQAFMRCELCSYDFRTDEGERSCHYYECPSLPEELDVWCPTCRYNFMVEDGNPECGDPPNCAFARTVAPARVRALNEWLAIRG